MKASLGTQLRHLVELLDGPVSAAYAELGLDYRPRYTPVMRALIRLESCTIGQIAEVARITQPAATQTVALMLKTGLISVEAGPQDARQKLIRLTAKGHELLPTLTQCWQATQAAADNLEAELNFSLVATLEAAIEALSRKSFATRIREARESLAAATTPSRSKPGPAKKIAAKTNTPRHATPVAASRKRARVTS